MTKSTDNLELDELIKYINNKDKSDVLFDLSDIIIKSSFFIFTIYNYKDIPTLLETAALGSFTYNAFSLMRNYKEKLRKKDYAKEAINTHYKMQLAQSVTVLLSLKYAYNEILESEEAKYKWDFTKVSVPLDEKSSEYEFLRILEIENIEYGERLLEDGKSFNKEEYWSITSGIIIKAIERRNLLDKSNYEDLRLDLINRSEVLYEAFKSKIMNKSDEFKIYINQDNNNSVNIKLSSIENIVKKSYVNNTIENSLLTKSVPVMKYFIGRDDYIDKVKGIFTEVDAAVSLRGIGGIGKTEIARKYYQSHKDSYNYHGWIEYNNNLVDSFVESFDLDIYFDEKDGNNEKYIRIMRHLNNKIENGILVINNLESGSIEIEDECDDINGLTNFDILITTREKFKQFEEIPVNFFSENDLISLFNNYCTNFAVSDEDISEIIERAGKLTLIVELIAKTANELDSKSEVNYMIDELKKNLNLNEVIDIEVDTNRRDLKSDKFYNHLTVLFNISKIDDDELYILMNLSVLPKITKSQVLYSLINQNDERIFCKRILKRLVTKGWITEFINENGDKYNEIHPVVLELIQHYTTPDVLKCKNLIEGLINLFEMVDYVDYSKFDYIIGYLESILKYLDHIETEEIAKLSLELSKLYLSIGQYENSLEYALKELEVNKSIYTNKEYVHIATSRSNISSIYRDMSLYNNSLENALESLEINTLIYPDKIHESIANDYSSISLIYMDMSQYERALEYAQKALSICEVIYGDNINNNLAACYNNMSLIYLETCQYGKSLECALKSIELSEELYGEKINLHLAVNYGNLSLVYKSMSQYKDALKYALKSVEIREILYTSKLSEELANSYNNISVIYMSMSQYENSLEYAEKSLTIRDSMILNKIDKRLASSYNNLSLIHMELSHYESSLDYALKSLLISETIYEGDMNGSLAISYNTISIIYSAMSQNEKSLEYALKSIEIYEFIYDDKMNGNLSTCYTNISTIYQDLGKFDEALDYAHKSINIDEFLYSDKMSSSLGSSYNNISGIYYDMNNFEKSLYYAEEALIIFEFIYKDKMNEKLATIYNNISNLYRYSNEYKDSIKYALKSIEIRELIYSDKRNINLALSYNTISMVYNDLGKYKLSLDYALKELEIYEFVYNDTVNENLANCYSNLSLIYKDLGQIGKAFKYSQKYKSYNGLRVND